MDKKCALLGIVLAGSITMSLSAFAGGYVGVAMGTSDYDAEEDGTSFELTGGYAFNDNFALQVSYVDYGDIDDNDPPVWTIEADAIEISGVGMYALGESLNLVGMLGMAAWDVSLSEEGYGVLGETDGTDLFYGIGLSFAASDSVSLDVKYKDYDISLDGTDVELSNISAGVNYRW